MSRGQNLIDSAEISIADAMKKIDDNGYGILFLVDSGGFLQGSITDGDIRRFLLSGGKMGELAITAATKDPLVAYTIEDAKRLYNQKDYVVIPIIDSDGIVVDFFAGSADKDVKEYKSLGIPVVINAGGKGTRLDPLTRVLPKPLIPVGELPIIEHIMHEYQRYDCNEFHIITNYKRELLKAYFNDSVESYNISWYDEVKPLGTGGGLSLLRKKMKSTFFFVNCDVLLTSNYEEILQFHKDNENEITMVCANKRFSIPYGVVEVNEFGSIEKMTEKPELSFLTNTGIYIVEPQVFNYLEDGVSIGFPDVIKVAMEKGRKVGAYSVPEDEWMDMGQLPELEKMRIKLYGE